MEWYSWGITNDCDALSCILKQELFRVLEVVFANCWYATYRQGSKQYQLHENWYCLFRRQLPRPSSPGWNSIDSSYQRHPNEKTTRRDLCLGNKHFREDDSVMVTVYSQEKWTSLTFFFIRKRASLLLLFSGIKDVHSTRKQINYEILYSFKVQQCWCNTTSDVYKIIDAMRSWTDEASSSTESHKRRRDEF